MRLRRRVFRPRFVAVTCGRSTSLDQSLSPLPNDSPFFPIGGADQRIPATDEFFRDLRRCRVVQHGVPPSLDRSIED